MSQEQLDVQLVESDVKNEGLEKSHETEVLPIVSTVKILEIAHVLQQKAVFLNGGKDKENNPLVICSHGVESYTEDDFKNAITFLQDTAKLLWNEYKFVVIINRQSNKWNNVKSILKYIQLFSEEKIQHILLLKPQGFLQRHFGSNDPKHIQSLSKHKIIFLDNIGMLDEYVEQSQLPDELGGFNGFNIFEWVEYTTAVERFQNTCMKVKQRLNDIQVAFSDKTPFSSIDMIDRQGKQQEQLVEDVNDDIRCTIEIAETLIPIVNKPLSHSRRDQSPLERYNSAQLQVCTEKLSTYGKIIDKLWHDQKIYHEQARELCNFEKQFAEVSQPLLQITSILESRTDIGDSLTSAKDLFEELDDFELKRKAPYDEMMNLKERGTSMLVLFGSFAHNSVQVRLNEIKHLCHNFESKLEDRRNLLQISLDVFTCLDKLDIWCKSGVDLLAAQPAEAFGTEEGAKTCLQELDKFMKNGKGINMKKMNQLDSLCKKLKNPMIDEKVKQALKRIEEVKGMLEKREASLKKVAVKPVRPIQPVKAMVVEKDVQKKQDRNSLKAPMSPTPPVDKKEISVVVTDDIEKYKRNKTFRKSLRMSFRRPVSSPAQLQLAEYEEDPEHRKKIRHVITELINTERDYINDLQCILETYYAAFDDINMNIPHHIRSQKHVIFGNIKEIYQFHTGNFMDELETCRDAPYLAGQVFMDKKEQFQLYATYCKNKPKSEAVRKELHETSFLHEYQKQIGHQLNLDSYLLKPVQRITKYKLLLTEMLKYVSKRNPAHADIMEALHTMKKVLRHVNDVMHSSGLVGFGGNLDDEGKLVLQDSFTVWECKKNTLKQFTKLGGKQRQVFLFENCLIFSKREMDNGRELGTYQCKRYLKTAEVGVTEVVKGDVCKFELWVQGRNETFILQAANLDVKNNWLTEIRRILMSQFEGVKENKSRKISVDDSERKKISKEDLQNKLKLLDPSLRSSTPTLSALANVHIDHISGGRDAANKLTSLRASSASDLLDVEEDTDSGWSDSEFDEDEETKLSDEVIEEETTQQVVVVDEAQPEVEIGVNTFVAIADYSAVEESELSFNAGDLLNLIKEGDGGWWYCKDCKSLKEGWAPCGYLEIFAVDVTHAPVEEKKAKPVKPSAPSPRRRLETAV
ncbi:guanine nucleotide exchange factor DBS-like [Hydractinia symbiolongicarpus]|uniref:guanine nucleotide exchange factor DBS-like n=1 Tax=Hydractinia symbiolongicarpus TaxID=13093 RepID=UPI00254A37F2|nr:guanine nucleotide exchange factor DBS-like [Hydractinia symbiolongicarpus]